MRRRFPPHAAPQAAAAGGQKFLPSIKLCFGAVAFPFSLPSPAPEQARCGIPLRSTFCQPAWISQ